MNIIPQRKTRRVCASCNDNVLTDRWITCKACKKPMCVMHIDKFNTMIYDFNNNIKLKGYICTDCYISSLW